MSNRTVIKTVLSNKIAPPEPGWFFERLALIHTLANLSVEVRKIWISSPGGAGKTTLVRSFLASDTRPLVWYQVDDEDQDPANLFFYLSQAVPADESGSKPLPQLTPEYLPNLPVFCRNFFRAFFARFEQGCVVVFDDLQDGPGESFFGPVLTAAMAELPANSTLFVLSREEPYPSLARDRVNRSLAHLSWDDLRLSFEETRRFLFWSQEKEPSPQDMDRAYSLTQGWLAGLLLYLNKPEAVPLPQHFSFDRTELLFDYFAGETFVRLPVETQTFLLSCSYLPTIDTGMAERLTGRRDAGDILRALMRGNHFTFRISATPAVYRFHPLFRHFLQTRAVQELDARRLDEVRVHAAHLLLASGQAEAAAELLIATQDWPALIGLVSAQAGTLLQQNRTHTLLVWMQALPDKYQHTDPWLCYWKGCCLNAENPVEAREDLTCAFELFDAAGDVTGSMLAWAAAVYSIVVGWNSLAELDVWIARIYRLRERFPDYPSPEIEALMVQSICQALTWRQPAHPDLPVWAARLHQLILSSTNQSFRILAGSDLIFYHTAIGELASAQALVELLKGDLHSNQITPVMKLVWFATKGFCECFSFERQECTATIEAGQAYIRDSGIHVMDPRVFGPGIALALSAGDLALARKLLDELEAVPIIASMDQSFQFLLAADFCSQDGDSAKAIALAELAVSKGEMAGTPIIISFSLAVLILALYRSGDGKRAREELARASTVCRGMNYFVCLFDLLAVFFLLEDGDTDSAHCLLQKSLGIAAQQGYRNFFPWSNEVLIRLCRVALVAGIEVDYVKRLASLHKLDISQPRLSSLTPKEIEILIWVKEGKTNWEIAHIRGVSERTVKFHITNVLQKLGASTRAHAVSIALEHGLMAPD